MRYNLSGAFILINLIAITTLTCKQNIESFKKLKEELREAENIRNNLEIYTKNAHADAIRQKKIIVAKLRDKIIRSKYTLQTYTKNDDWIEDHVLYGVDNQQVFKIAKDYYNGEVYASRNNRSSRKLIYLALEYRRLAIINFEIILNKLAEKANIKTTYKQNEYDVNTEYNVLIEDILTSFKKYAHNYFEIALIPLSQKQKDLYYLSLKDLQLLKDKFDELQKIRDTGKIYVVAIYNDFQNNKDNIKDGDAVHLKNYINGMRYKYKFKKLANKAEELAYQISQILNVKKV
ncbi:Putative membrane spanning protein (plasmid) [Borrelia crocidurae DOU]|uniref:Putative membrane spanning protein n=1 Tax=Borrelia crocidurae DOU TaxID=1293575 RepID=W5SKR1_9SPIR|nr:virulence associated lipoprotein [Borrelia crocidurae]AHH07460.1 Putative membrane spanning protein [Borrelia crocidurae DOU]